MSDASTNKNPDDTEPSAESLAEMPELDSSRFVRRPGRGHHRARAIGELVAVDADLWPHFGSAESVNAALRGLVEAAKHVRRPGS